MTDVDDEALVAATIDAYSMRPPILSEADLLVRLSESLQGHGVDSINARTVARDSIPRLWAVGLLREVDHCDRKMVALNLEENVGDTEGHSLGDPQDQGSPQDDKRGGG